METLATSGLLEVYTIFPTPLALAVVVVPIFKDVLLESDTTLDHVNEIPQVKAVLDIDSKELSTFDETDARYLEKLAVILSGRFQEQ